MESCGQVVHGKMPCHISGDWWKLGRRIMGNHFLMGCPVERPQYTNGGFNHPPLQQVTNNPALERR
jgi:hypothetical protein